MKKFKKRDLKKLALLGLASGTALATQAIASEQASSIDPSQALAFNGCGGRNGCGHSGDQAYRNTPSQNNGYYYTNQSCGGQFGANGQPQSGSTSTTPPSSGCGGSTPSAGQSPTAYNQRGSYYYPQQWNSAQPTQPQTSCAGMTQPQAAPSNGNASPSSASGSPSPTAYSQGGSYYYPQQWNSAQPTQPQTSCAASAQPKQISSGCGGNSRSQGQLTAYEPRGSSSSSSQPQMGCGGSSQPKQAYSGCGSAPSPKGQSTAASNKTDSGYFQPWQSTRPAEPQTGCASRAQPSDDSPQGSTTYMERYNRWESADTGKSSSAQTSMPAMTENELMIQLNPQGKITYQSLDAAGKALALKLANQTCKGQNECKGLNSCKAADHACAGKGSCAGTSTGPFKDKNLAVKVAAMKMAEKRAKASPSK